MAPTNPLLKSLVEDTSTLKGVNADGTPITVVVADDEISHRKIIVQILRSMGCNVLGEAKDGEEAVYMYNIHRPQLVTCDYHMPRMEGIVALVEMRKINPAAVVVMTTSENHSDIVREVFKRGATDYILKPFDRATFIEKIEKVIVQHVRTKTRNQFVTAEPPAQPAATPPQASSTAAQATAAADLAAVPQVADLAAKASTAQPAAPQPGKKP
ncbi:MAG: response regulator [Spirochaetota bacterium]